MGFSKTFLLLGLSLAIVLLISSEAAARELINTEDTRFYSTDSADAATHGGVNYHKGGGHGGGGGGGHYDGGPGGFHHRERGGCRYGRCLTGCCNYAGEVVEAETAEAKPHN